MTQTILAALLLAPLLGLPAADTPRPARPNMLIAVADDLSHVHRSFAGCWAVNTPALDREARDGVYVRNAFAPTPGCSPTGASLLTGRHPWQIEQGGTHASSFPANYVAFPDLPERAGYVIGWLVRAAGGARYEGRNAFFWNKGSWSRALR